MKVGIISDTHDCIGNIEKALRIFKREGIGQLLHPGDFINPMSVRAFQGFELIGVLGNNDGEKFGLQQAFTDIGGTLHEHMAELELGGKKIAMYHGTSQPIKEALVRCGSYDIVVCGHTHAVENTTVGKTLVINPGTAHGFGKTPTVAMLDMEVKKATIIEL